MSAVVIVLPSIGQALDIPASGQQIVVSIYNISLGCLMLLWGRIADVYGHRLVFLIGSILFTLSTLCLPFAADEIPFCILRFLQGTSGAAMVPAGLGTIATTFAPGKSRNRGFVAVAAVASLGSIFGNLAGGLVGGYLSWKWVFWIPAIIAAFTTVAAAVIMPTPKLRRQNTSTEAIGQRNKALTVDWFGGAVVSSSLLLLLVALSEGNVVGWSTPWIPPAFVIAVILLVIFVFWQRRLERGSGRQPLLKLSMFSNVNFSGLLITIGCFFASYNSFLIFATYFYQDYLGLSELQTTLRFLPAGISGVLFSFVLSLALSRIPGFYILMFGLVCCTVPPLLFAISAISPQTTYWAYGFPAMVLCFSVEVIWPVGSLVIAKELPREDQALGSALLMTANFVGRALGLAIASSAQIGVQGNDISHSGDPGLLLLHAVRDYSRDESNAYVANTNKFLLRLGDVLSRTWDLGFTAFGGPPVHFQIQHRRFVQGTHGRIPWIDERVLAEKAINDKLTRILVIFGACAGMCYSALWYFPILIVAGGIVTVIWDSWLRQQIGKARAKWVARRDRSTPESARQEADESIELPERSTRSNQDGISGVQRRHVAAQASTNFQPAPRTNDTAPVAEVDRTDVKSYAIPIPIGLTIIAGFFATFIGVLIAHGVLNNPPRLLNVFANMYLAGTIIFGGGPVVIPLLREYVVQPGWVSPRDFLIGLAIIQAFPGPNFNFAVYLGALAVLGTPYSTVLGAFISYMGIFVPVTSLLRGINATAVGLVFTAVYRLSQIGYLTQESSSGQSLARDPWWVVITVLSYAGNAWFKVPAPVAIVAGGILGLCWYGAVGS
ncbi:hypothetical protein DV736_g222, partial [Chaetothyriales sp. CBS 134916]